MNLFHRGTARAPITLQSLMHLLHWKEVSAAISISCLGNGNTARLSNLLKVTQKSVPEQKNEVKNVRSQHSQGIISPPMTSV